MFSYEKRLIKEEEITPEGLIPLRFETPFWLISTLLFLSGVYYTFINTPQNTLNIELWASIVLSILCARLITLDLRHYVLLDIYTLPILITGLLFAPYITHISYTESLIGASLGIILPFVFSKFLQVLRGNESMVIGGGDIKMISAALAWLGISQASFFILLACLFSSIFFFLPKEKALPFGPGLILSFYAFLLFDDHVKSLLFKVFTFIYGS